MIKKKAMGNGLAQNSIILTFVSMLTTLLGIVVSKLLAVNFSLEDYGTYSQIILVITTLTSVTILGLSDATNFYYNKMADREQQRKYVSAVFSLQYCIGTICAVLVFSFGRTIVKYFGNEDLMPMIAVIAFTPLFQNLIRMYQVLFVSTGRAKVLALRNVIVAVLRLCVTIFACYYAKDIRIVVFSVLVLDIAQTVYYAASFGHSNYYLIPTRFNHSVLREILKYSIPMSVYILVNTLTRDVDKYVINALADTETLAVYSIASKMLPFDILTSSLLTVLVPVITRYIGNKQYEKTKEVYKLYLRVGFIVTAILVGGSIALAKNLMLFLYDDKYLIGLKVFVIYLFVDLIRFANMTLILSSAGKTRTLMIISITTLVANAILNVCSFKLLGMIGPALTTLGVTLWMVITTMYFAVREIHCKVTDLFDLKEMLLLVAEIVIIGSGAHALAVILESNGTSNAITLICCYGLYAIGMTLLNYKRLIGAFKEINKFK